MAREYGKIMSAIWRDQDFKALASGPQRLYILLLSQADISSCGALGLAINRWASCAPDTDVDRLWHDLRALESANFVVIDRGTDELLVRSFIKWDHGYTNHKRRPAIAAAAASLTSQRIRGLVAATLIDFKVPHSMPDVPSALLSDSPSIAKPIPQGLPGAGNLEPGAGNLKPETGNRKPKNISSEAAPSDPARPEIEDLCQRLAKAMVGNGTKRPTISKAWREATRLMLDRDGRSVIQIEKAIDWSTADEFWRANILSMPKLREKYDQLRLAAGRSAREAKPVRRDRYAEASARGIPESMA
jgi:hypothetical protein